MARPQKLEGGVGESLICALELRSYLPHHHLPPSSDWHAVLPAAGIHLHMATCKQITSALPIQNTCMQSHAHAILQAPFEHK
jgi:hypothetical protein